MKKLIIILSLLCSTVISFSQEEQPVFTTATIKVTATDFEKHPRANEVITLQGKQSKKDYVGLTDKDGKVVIVVPKGDNYTVFQRAIRFFVTHGEIEIPNGPEKFTMNLTLELKTIDKSIGLPNSTLVLDRVFFETGGTKLIDNSDTIVDNLYQVLAAKPTLQIEISGHTDNTGNAELNNKLSLARAEAIKAILVHKGIEATRVETKGFGSSKPVATNATIDGRSKNRRIEVRILSY